MVAVVIGAVALVGVVAAVAVPALMNRGQPRVYDVATVGTVDAPGDDASAPGAAVGEPGGDTGATDRAAQADDAAFRDVANLGVELASWYVDRDGPPPVVEVVDGQYLVDGYVVGDVSPGIELGGVRGTGGLDWCVWVLNHEGTVPTYEYSAEAGLQEGTC